MRDIKEILEDYPSLKLQYEQMENMSFVRLLLKKDQRKELDRIKKEMKDLIMTTEEYNNNFSDYGWIAYSLINVEFMKNANIIFKENGIEKAEDFISDYYKDNIKNTKRFIQYSTKEFRKRANIIDEAFEAYESEKYYSAITLFLTIADGVINDFTKNKGFFTEGVDLDCWDCLVECDKGLKKLKEIYNLSRKKTVEDMVTMPYRNGILHGRDLNFGNKYVAGKCNVLLLAISEWIKSKNTEESRFSTAIEQPFTIDTINVVFNINQDGEHPLLKTYYENNSNKTITNMTLQVKYKNTDTVEDINISGLVSSGEKSKEVLIVGPDSRLVEDVEILKYKISIEDGVYMEYNPITSEYNWS